MSAGKVKRDKNGVWYAQPYLGRRPDGRQIRPRRSFPSARSEAEAQAMADAWMRTLEPGGTAKSGLIADMLDAYADARPDVAENTRKQWRSFTRAHVRRYLAGKTPGELTASDMAGFEGRLLAPKERGGAGLSASSVTAAHYFLRGAWNWWQATGICEGNPMVPVRHPRAEGREAEVVDEAELGPLEHALETAISGPDRERAACAFAAWLALHAGLRVGEACGLRRRDARYREGSLHVAGTVIEAGGPPVRQAKTKGKKARNVAMAAPDMEHVRAWAAGCAEACGALGRDDPLVTADGSLMRPSAVSRGFKELARELGLPEGVTFHSLRHTHGTWLLTSGIDVKTVSERLGHADVSTTLSVYAHVLPGRDAQAAEVFRRDADLASGKDEQ